MVVENPRNPRLWSGLRQCQLSSSHANQCRSVPSMLRGRWVFGIDLRETSACFSEGSSRQPWDWTHWIMGMEPSLDRGNKRFVEQRREAASKPAVGRFAGRLNVDQDADVESLDRGPLSAPISSGCLCCITLFVRPMNHATCKSKPLLESSGQQTACQLPTPRGSVGFALVEKRNCFAFREPICVRPDCESATGSQAMRTGQTSALT